MTWTDRLATRFLGDTRARVTRTIESPATPDMLEITFSDGSRLFIRVEVDPPRDGSNEVEAAILAEQTTAMRAYGRIIGRLYQRAVLLDTDLDIGPESDERSN